MKDRSNIKTEHQHENRLINTKLKKEKRKQQRKRGGNLPVDFPPQVKK